MHAHARTLNLKAAVVVIRPYPKPCQCILKRQWPAHFAVCDLDLVHSLKTTPLAQAAIWRNLGEVESNYAMEGHLITPATDPATA